MSGWHAENWRQEPMEAIMWSGEHCHACWWVWRLERFKSKDWFYVLIYDLMWFQLFCAPDMYYTWVGPITPSMIVCMYHSGRGTGSNRSHWSRKVATRADLPTGCPSPDCRPVYALRFSQFLLNGWCHPHSMLGIQSVKRVVCVPVDSRTNNIIGPCVD